MHSRNAKAGLLALLTVGSLMLMAPGSGHAAPADTTTEGTIESVQANVILSPRETGITRR